MFDNHGKACALILYQPSLAAPFNLKASPRQYVTRTVASIICRYKFSLDPRLYPYVKTYLGPSPPCGVVQVMSWSGTLISHVLQCMQLFKSEYYSWNTL